MAISNSAISSIWLGGKSEPVIINDIAASEAVTPGYCVERFNSAGTIRFRKVATASLGNPFLIAKEHSMCNKGIGDAYAAADLLEVVAPGPGDKVAIFIASGQNITAGDKLEFANDGTLKIYSSGVVVASADETSGAVTVATRLRVTAAR